MLTELVLQELPLLKPQLFMPLFTIEIRQNEAELPSLCFLVTYARR